MFFTDHILGFGRFNMLRKFEGSVTLEGTPPLQIVTPALAPTRRSVAR